MKQLLRLCLVGFAACQAAPHTRLASQPSAGASAWVADAGPPARADAGSQPFAMLTPPPTQPRAGSPAPAPDDAGIVGKPDGAAAGSDAAAGAAPEFLDAFDDATALDTARYEVVMPRCSGNGVVRLDTTTAHSGSHSVQVKASGGYCNHVFFRPKTLPSPLPDPLYVRVFVKLEQALGAGHVTFVALRDTHDNADLRMGGQNQILMWNRESDDATLPELSPVGVAMSTAPSVGSWHCVEWRISAQPAGCRLGSTAQRSPVCRWTARRRPTWIASG